MTEYFSDEKESAYVWIVFVLSILFIIFGTLGFAGCFNGSTPFECKDALFTSLIAPNIAVTLVLTLILLESFIFFNSRIMGLIIETNMESFFAKIAALPSAFYLSCFMVLAGTLNVLIFLATIVAIVLLALANKKMNNYLVKQKQAKDFLKRKAIANSDEYIEYKKEKSVVALEDKEQ